MTYTLFIKYLMSLEENNIKEMHNYNKLFDGTKMALSSFKGVFFFLVCIINCWKILSYYILFYNDILLYYMQK